MGASRQWWRRVRNGDVLGCVPASQAIIAAYDRLGWEILDRGPFDIAVWSGLNHQVVRESSLQRVRAVVNELHANPNVDRVYVDNVPFEAPVAHAESPPRRQFHVKAPPRDQLVGRKVVFPIDPSGVVADRFDVVVDVGPLLSSRDDPPIWNVGFTSAGAQAWGLGDAYKGTVSLRAADETAARERFAEQFGSKFTVTSVARMP